MRRRSIILLSIAVSAATLGVASDIHATEALPPLPSPSMQDVNDTVISNATKSIIESFGELTRTATKLSETALKLIEAQKEIDEKRERRNAQTTQTTQTSQTTQTAQTAQTTQTSQTAQTTQTTQTTQAAQTAQTTQTAQTAQTTQTAQTSQTTQTTQTAQTAQTSQTAQTTPDTIYVYPDQRPGGRYIWVPDGGKLKSSLKASTEPDLKEMTFWKGDSIPMAIPTKRYGRFDRKLYNWLIYPRGQWHISLSANYGGLSTENSEFLSLMKDIDMNGKIYSVKPAVSYFFKSNLCAGLRLAFTKGEMNISNFKVDIDEDMNFNLHDVKYSSDSYAAAIYLQQHFGLSRRGRFSVYNEVELAFGTGNKHFVRPFDGEMKDTRTKTNSFNINYSPGVSIMMMKQAAFNLSFGIFGFHLQNEKQWENGEESGNRLTSGINFRFNIFNINFGVSIII